MNTPDSLAGLLRLRPGQARPRSLENRRPDWVATLLLGRPAHEAPGRLASLYSLCGHAHRLCAELALRAATGEAAPRLAGAERALQRETACEHLRRIGLDWPARLAPPASRDAIAAEALQALRDCPLLRDRQSPLDDTRRWLELRLLGMPAWAWLAGWKGDPDWWREWSLAGSGWLPRLIRQARPWADWPVRAAAPLHVHAQPASLRELAASLRADAGFTRQPLWRGRCAETGSWTRLHEAARPAPATPWQRLGARVAELVRLSLPDVRTRSGSGWLAAGALPLAAGEGLAWVEMARGLLVHQVRLDPAAAQPCVAGYRVLAPTEWNFHADGAVALALEGLGGTCQDGRESGSEGEGETAQRIEALMAAYDPCVRFEVERPCQRESIHA